MMGKAETPVSFGKDDGRLSCAILQCRECQREMDDGVRIFSLSCKDACHSRRENRESGCSPDRWPHR